MSCLIHGAQPLCPVCDELEEVTEEQIAEHENNRQDHGDFLYEQSKDQMMEENP